MTWRLVEQDRITRACCLLRDGMDHDTACRALTDERHARPDLQVDGCASYLRIEDSAAGVMHAGEPGPDIRPAVSR